MVSQSLYMVTGGLCWPEHTNSITYLCSAMLGHNVARWQREEAPGGCLRMKSLSSSPWATSSTVISTPTHRTFCICFASGAGAETRLIRGIADLSRLAGGTRAIGECVPRAPLCTSSLARLPGIRGRMIIYHSTALPEAANSLRGWLRGRSLSDPVRPRPVARE